MRIEEKTVVDASRERIWETISDPANYRRLLTGVTRWEVEGERDVGLGARYAMRMRVRSAEVGGLIEIVEFDEPGDLAWTSVTGVDQRGRWRLREGENGQTEVTLRLAYQSPGGMLGALSDRASAPLVRRNLRDSLLRLQGELEGKPVKSESGGAGLLDSVKQQLLTAKVLVQTGALRLERPDRAVRAGVALVRWGPTPAAGYAASAARYPHEEAVIDELGSLRPSPSRSSARTPCT